MAEPSVVRLIRRPLSLVRDSVVSRHEAQRPEQAAHLPRSPFRQVLLAAAMAAGGILAVAAVMMVGAL